MSLQAAMVAEMVVVTGAATTVEAMAAAKAIVRNTASAVEQM